MSSIKINGKEYNDVQLVKLKQGQADAAIGKLNSTSQGADDVVFKVGNDLFVASGRGLFDGKKMSGKPFMGGEGITVELDGKKAEVLAWDNQANTGVECAKWARNQLYAIPILGVILGDVVGKIGLKWGALIGVAAYGASAAGGYVYGASRKMNVDELGTMGTVVQQNTQSKGGWGDAIKNLFGKK